MLVCVGISQTEFPSGTWSFTPFSFLLARPPMHDRCPLHPISTHYFQLLQQAPTFLDSKALSYLHSTPKMSDRTTWGEKAHLDLLLAILNHATIPNSDWDSKILPELRAKGYTYTLSAALYALSTQFIRSSRLPSRSSLVQHTKLQLPAPPFYTLTFPPHSSTFSRFNHFQKPCRHHHEYSHQGPCLQVGSRFRARSLRCLSRRRGRAQGCYLGEGHGHPRGKLWRALHQEGRHSQTVIITPQDFSPQSFLQVESLILKNHPRHTYELNTASICCPSANFLHSQHLQKLKRKEGTGAPKKTATPNKRNKTATEGDDDEAPKKKKQRKTPNKAASGHADDQDDDEDVQLQLKNEEG